MAQTARDNGGWGKLLHQWIGAARPVPFILTAEAADNPVRGGTTMQHGLTKIGPFGSIAFRACSSILPMELLCDVDVQACRIDHSFKPRVRAFGDRRAQRTLLAQALDRIDLDESESALFKAASRLMTDALDRSCAAPIRLAAQDHTTQEELRRPAVPARRSAVLARVLSLMAKNRSLTLLLTLYPIQVHVTTKRAAEFLGVSRAYLICVGEAEKIPYFLVGRHRRVLMKDVVEFAESMRAARKRALDHTVQLSEEAKTDELEYPQRHPGRFSGGLDACFLHCRSC